MNPTLRQVLPVAVSILLIISIAILRAYSKTLAAITATMPINVPLATWIVYSAENGDRDATAEFTGSLVAGLGATVIFTLVLWGSARAGLNIAAMLALSYLSWGGLLAAYFLLRGAL